MILHARIQALGKEWTLCEPECHPLAPSSLHAFFPATPSLIPHFVPPALPPGTDLPERRVDQKKEMALGTKCGVLGMHRHPLSPPTYGGQTEGAEAQNRWLIADFILPVVHLWDYQNLKKNLHPQPPPSIIGTSDWPEFGSNALRPVLSYSMAC